MKFYLIKRLFLIFPTLFFIMLLNFIIIQAAPGGPIEQIIAKINNSNTLHSEVSFNPTSTLSLNINSDNNKSTIDQEIIKKIEVEYGFDKPLLSRFLLMMKKLIMFDFSSSFYQDKSVVSLVIEKLPVSISLGFASTILVYLISIPLGIRKALRNGSKFDFISSVLISLGHAIPAFLLAIIFIVLFAGGNFLQIFPIRGLTSDNFSDLSIFGKIIDYLHHLFLPIASMVIGGFASLTFFVKNSFIEEINKQYVVAAYAKGLGDRQVLYGHIFRNAMMIVIAGIPAAFIGILFTGSMLIEIIFNLDGLGLLGYEAAVSRDYPVMFGTLYFFTLLGLIINIISDITYKIVDPRINFN